jgi:hypothetical protein
MTSPKIQKTFERFEVNLRRTRALVAVYAEPGKVGRPPTHRADLLRAAVVFLHASLEDLMRSLEEELIDRYVRPGMPLHKVTFALPSNGRPDSISLSELVTEYPNANVADILADALAAHRQLQLQALQRRTYNNVAEIKEALDRVQVPKGADQGMPYGLSKQEWSKIATITARRHLIAHRLDRNEASGRGHHLNTPISSDGLQGWVDIVLKLGDSVRRQL